jgi:phosphopantetheinyl transferase (holo-ACP synthase)
MIFSLQSGELPPLSGCGIDCEQVARFERAPLNEPGSLAFFFSSREMQHCAAHSHPPLLRCAVFCAKEAFAKALGTTPDFPRYSFLPQLNRRRCDFVAAPDALPHSLHCEIEWGLAGSRGVLLATCVVHRGRCAQHTTLQRGV